MNLEEVSGTALDERPIYVVGFPKSGNTWLLRMLCDLCDANIDQSDVINAAGNRPEREKVIHKVHFADPAELLERGRVVYIVRDVRDVLVSGFFHNHRRIDEESVLLEGGRSWKRILLRPYFRHHIKRLNKRWRGTEIAAGIAFALRGLSRLAHPLRGAGKRHRGIGWSEHVLWWSGAGELCLVRYEDLLADTAAQLERVSVFLGLGCHRGEIATVASRHSFTEKKEQFRRSGDLANELFMRKGCAGDWQRFLDAELVKEIVTLHARGLEAMNYRAEAAAEEGGWGATAVGGEAR